MATLGIVAGEQDCNGDRGRTAATADNCGVCIGGKTINKTCTGFIGAKTGCTIDGIILETKNEGFSGSGYVNTDNLIGACVSWKFTSTSSQTTTISFKYANGGTIGCSGTISINGNYPISLPPTGS